MLLVFKKKIGGNHSFYGDNRASIWKKRTTSFIALYFDRFLEQL